MTSMTTFQHVAFMIESKETKVRLTTKCITIAVLGLVLFQSCADKGWQPQETILLDGVAPIGLSFWNDEIWLSDGDNNRLVVIDESGKVLREVGPIERPMHTISRMDKMYVPSYGADEIYVFGEATIDTIRPDVEMEGPGGVDVVNGLIAIADFYNHQVVFYNGSEWSIIGKKGKEDGQFYYPTDVQIEGDKLWVADAYNNRIQVFDLEGNLISILGDKLGMNAATGVYVGLDDLYITDFENSRLFQLDHQGNVIQEINTGLDKPTDLVIHNKQMWVLNYAGKYISIYTE